MRPLIGLTADREPSGDFSALPYYALRENYCEAVAEAGGAPLILPHHVEEAERYLELLDGLVITGGAFDVDPALFGAAERHESVTTKDRRTAFEKAIGEAAIARDLPILGVCGGQQLLNVLLGGSLIQDIASTVSQPLAHEQPNPRCEPGHEVFVEKGTLLSAICGASRLEVNSAHHQAVDRLGEGTIASAWAPDGVIEAIEQPDKRFCLGVQWHPEYAVDPADRRILRAFVEAADGFRRAR